jgi:hypothetical protein
MPYHRFFEGTKEAKASQLCVQRRLACDIIRRPASSSRYCIRIRIESEVGTIHSSSTSGSIILYSGVTLLLYIPNNMTSVLSSLAKAVKPNGTAPISDKPHHLGRGSQTG